MKNLIVFSLYHLDFKSKNFIKVFLFFENTLRNSELNQAPAKDREPRKHSVGMAIEFASPNSGR